MSEGDLEFRRDDKAWAEFRAEINRQLNERRPERIGIGETEWREPVYAWARNHMPDESHLIRHIAKREVDRCETEATKKGNKLIREWMRGLLPLDWSLVGPYPVKVGEVRVRLDVATPEDVDRAVKAARKAFRDPSWGGLTATARGHCIKVRPARRTSP